MQAAFTKALKGEEDMGGEPLGEPLGEEEQAVVEREARQYSRVRLFAERTVRHLLHKATMDLSSVKPSDLRVAFDQGYFKETNGSIRFSLLLMHGSQGVVEVSQVCMMHDKSSTVSEASRGMNRFLRDVNSRLAQKHSSLRMAYKDLHASVTRGATAAWLRMDRSMLDTAREANALEKVVSSMPDDSVRTDMVRGSPVLGDMSVAWPLVAHMLLAREDYDVVANAVKSKSKLLAPDSLFQRIFDYHREG